MGAQPSTLGGAFEMEADAKWLTISTNKPSPELLVQDQATATLQALGVEKLSLVMVYGQARTGKSFLMNKLIGEPGFFTVRAGHVPTTVGVDLSPFMPYSAFTGSTGSSSSSSSSSSSTAGDKVGFVDVEGQGDRGINYDVMLAAPLLLVSKVGG